MNFGLMEIRLVSASIFVLEHIILFIAFVLNSSLDCFLSNFPILVNRSKFSGKNLCKGCDLERPAGRIFRQLSQGIFHHIIEAEPLALYHFSNGCVHTE